MAENSVEIGIKPPPASTWLLEAKHAAVTPLETVPEEAIASIEINKKALGWLPPELHYLCSEEYFRRVCVMTVPPEIQKERRILTPGFWGRAVPLAYGQIPYEEFVGGTLIGKGCFLSGLNYSSALKRRLPISDNDWPWGFFGDKDARNEIEIGNMLLDFKFRSSLGLGYVVLDSGKLRDFLLAKWQKYPHICQDINEGLNIVARNQDKPAFFVRVCGVTERGVEVFSESEGKIIERRRKAEIARAANLLKTEATIFPGRFSEYMQFGSLTQEPVVAVLDKLSNRKPLNKEEETVLERFLYSIGNRNLHILEKILTGEVDGPSGSYSNTNLSSVLSAMKDVDLAFITQDYEGVHAERGTPLSTTSEKLIEYQEAYRGLVRSFFRDLRAGTS